MFKNILLLSIGYWGLYFLIINTPSIQTVYSDDFIWEVLDSPTLILKLGFGFVFGIIGYSLSVLTIFENYFSMLKSRKRLNLETILHTIAFFYSYFVLFMEHQFIVGFCFILSFIFGIRTYFSIKYKKTTL